MRFVILTFIAQFAVSALAQSNNQSASIPATNTPTVLPETVVVGKTESESLTSPSAKMASQQKKEIPGGFTIKTTDAMNQGRASNFLDLLAGVPGVFLQSENGMEVSKISIRGSGIDAEDEPLGVQFMFDGISMNQGDGETILEDFDVNTLKYAEIYRGANAFKYGGITLGGAINLVPLTGYDADPFQIRLEGGSYGFFRGQVSAAGVEGPLDYYVSLSGRTRDGYREHSAENTELLFANLGYKLNDHLENRLYVTLDQADRELPGGLTLNQMHINPQQAQTDPDSGNPDAQQFDFNKQWYYGRVADKLSYERNGHELDATIYYWHRSLEEKGIYFTNDLEQGIQDYEADDAGFSVDSVTRGQLFGRQNILTVGFSPEFETEQDHNFANLNGATGATIAKDIELSVNVPFYAEDQFYLTEKLSVLAGVQMIYVLRHFYDQFNNTDDGDQSTAQNFWGLNPKVGMLYEINDDNQIYANFSRSFQPPSFDHMVNFDDGAGVSLVYTPLSAQDAWTAEIGTRGKWNRFDWELSLYHSWVRNELQDLFDAQGVDRGDVNVANSYHQGIEADVGVELWNSKKIHDQSGHRITLNQTYTLNDFHFESDPVYGDNRLASIPIHLYQADLLYETPCGFYAGPNVQCNLSRYPVDQANTLYAGTYTLLGFKTGMNFNWRKHKISVFFEAKNLLDQTYAASVDPTPQGGPSDAQVFHPGDGRSFYSGMSFSW